ncbi:MAG: DMT family transporter [Elusimicrobia bacterium]|nr:DMT family transporter [Elusimicrobiota bacterium]
MALAFYSGNTFPALKPVLFALMLGFVGYGISLVLLVRAMRELGASRAGAFFGVYPFIGAILSVLWLGESVSLRLGLAFALTGSAAALLLGEKHAHAHAHEPLEHDHLHSHDGHHAHSHAHGEKGRDGYSHPHTHARLEHSHEHGPDAHHRYWHRDEG